MTVKLMRVHPAVCHVTSATPNTYLTQYRVLRHPQSMLGEKVLCSNKKSGETLVQYIILSFHELPKSNVHAPSVNSVKVTSLKIKFYRLV